MKAGVSKGQPLFAAVPAIPAAGLLAPQEQRREHDIQRIMQKWKQRLLKKHRKSEKD
jgi:hypothetical protein